MIIVLCHASFEKVHKVNGCVSCTINKCLDVYNHNICIHFKNSMPGIYFLFYPNESGTSQVSLDNILENIHSTDILSLFP